MTDTFLPRPLADIEADLKTALAPSSNGRLIVRHVARDEPFFYFADTAWELFHRLDRAEAEMFLRNRAAKGFNSIMIVVFAEHGGLDMPNRDGEWPFLPAPDSNAEQYVPDLTRPNPGYFEFVDWVVALASRLDMTIALVPTWGRYITGGYYDGPILFNEDNAHSFGRFLGERYPFHPFILGGDANRHWSREFQSARKAGKDVGELPLEDFGPVFEAMAAGIVEGENAARERLLELKQRAEGYEAFMTFHSAQVWHPKGIPTTASAQFPDAKWLSFDSVQTGHYDGRLEEATSAQGGAGGDHLWYSSSPYIPIREMYATTRPDGKPRPCLDLEAHYENTHHWFLYNQDLWTARDIRCGLWQSIFAGACGYTYGCNSIWQMHNDQSKTHPPIAPITTAYTNWYLELDLPGVMYAAVARRICLALPDFFLRVPDQSFILSDTEEREGERAGDRLAGGMRGKSWAAVHLPYGGRVEVDIGKVLGDTIWRAWWIDPRTGSLETFRKGNGGVREFNAPTAGSLDDDWILLVTTGDWPLPHQYSNPS